MFQEGVGYRGREGPGGVAPAEPLLSAFSSYVIWGTGAICLDLRAIPGTKVRADGKRAQWILRRKRVQACVQCDHTTTLRK